jgi:glycosyltransferase involved in cell wall biosynthesis
VVVAPVKIALIVPGGFAGPTKAIPVLSALADALSIKHEVHVFAFSSPGPVQYHRAGRAHIHTLADLTPARGRSFAPRNFMRARAAWQLAQEIMRTTSPTRFHLFHAFWATECGLFAAMLGRLMAVPVVLSVGGGESVWLADIQYGGAGTGAGRAVTRLAVELASEVTVGTQFARGFLPGLLAERAKVIPLGIAAEHFAASPDRPSGPPWRLLHVASMNKVKDQRALLDAFARVVVRMDDVSLDCVGEDTLGGQVQSYARALGLETRVRFHGFLPQERLRALFANSHLQVLSSRYESQGVVILEAAAAGLPTVGTAVGLMPTLAPGAACAVHSHEPGHIADAICALLADEPRRRAMGAAAKAFATTHDVMWTARAFEEIYARVAGP